MANNSGHSSAPSRSTAAPAADSKAGAELRSCRYPGCDRVLTDDSTTGRPGSYCEQPDPDGGPVHTRASAWRARRAAQQPASPSQQGEQAVAAPVSLARAGLEQHLGQLPGRIEGLQQFLTSLLTDLRVAGDVEAAGAEVADAHRDALAKITAAEQQVADAERARRSAEQRAGEAEALRAEADAAAEAATADAIRVRAELTAQLDQARADAEHTLAQAHGERDAAREETARLAVQADIDRQALIDLRADLTRVREDAHAERQALQHAADERVAALSEALSAAREANTAYRAQLGLDGPMSG